MDLFWFVKTKGMASFMEVTVTLSKYCLLVVQYANDNKWSLIGACSLKDFREKERKVQPTG
jgi:hypothetical protein